MDLCGLCAYYNKEYFCGILGAYWNWALGLVTGFTGSQKSFLVAGREGGLWGKKCRGAQPIERPFTGFFKWMKI
jgi:hypothetical protein